MGRWIFQFGSSRTLSTGVPIGLLLGSVAFVCSQNRSSFSVQGELSIASDAAMYQKFPTRIVGGDFERVEDWLSVPLKITTRVVARKCVLKRRAGLRLFDRGHNVEFRAEFPEFLASFSLLQQLNQRLRDDYEQAATEFVKTDWSSVVEGIRSPSYLLLNWERSVTVDILHSTDRAVSLLESRYEYQGGVHGNFQLVGRNVVASGGGSKELALDELFETASPWKSRLLSLCTSDLRCQGASSIGDCCVESPEEFGFTVEELTTFTLSPSGIAFYFSPYHVGCYAEGVYCVRIPWASIQDCVPWASPARLFMATDGN